MKHKKILVLGIALMAVISSGCGKQNKVIVENKPKSELCSKISGEISKYKKGNESFKELATYLENNYNSLCPEDATATCISIKGIITLNNKSYELKDCSQYVEGSFKDLCESSNKLTQESLDKKEEFEKAYVDELDRACALEEE